MGKESAQLDQNAAGLVRTASRSPNPPLDNGSEQTVPIGTQLEDAHETPPQSSCVSFSETLDQLRTNEHEEGDQHAPLHNGATEPELTEQQEQQEFSPTNMRRNTRLITMDGEHNGCGKGRTGSCTRAGKCSPPLQPDCNMVATPELGLNDWQSPHIFFFGARDCSRRELSQVKGVPLHALYTHLPQLNRSSLALQFPALCVMTSKNQSKRARDPAECN